MSSMRQQLLLTIYRQFEQWIEANNLVFICQKGCATCCTQNVNMTAVEGDLIHAFVNDHNKHHWFAEKLMIEKSRHQSVETTNEFAAHCLSGNESDDTGSHEREGVCPYLDDQKCQIYEVRPFACRSFASQKKCQADQPAELPQFYISATTAALQLIEHVGQGEYWGNMHDVLLALCDLEENEGTARLLPGHSIIDQARARLKKAKPLPGFLITGDDYDKVSPFILKLFNQKIGEKTVEDILNGK